MQLPPDVTRPFQVFVNGVEQTEGADYRVDGDRLVFAATFTAPSGDTARSLVRGFFWGRYRTEHAVDVAYQVGGRPTVASGLPFDR